MDNCRGGAVSVPASDAEIFSDIVGGAAAFVVVGRMTKLRMIAILFICVSI